MSPPHTHYGMILKLNIKKNQNYIIYPSASSWASEDCAGGSDHRDPMVGVPPRGSAPQQLSRDYDFPGVLSWASLFPLGLPVSNMAMLLVWVTCLPSVAVLKGLYKLPFPSTSLSLSPEL